MQISTSSNPSRRRSGQLAALLKAAFASVALLALSAAIWIRSDWPAWTFVLAAALSVGLFLVTATLMALASLGRLPPLPQFRWPRRFPDIRWLRRRITGPGTRWDWSRTNIALAILWFLLAATTTFGLYRHWTVIGRIAGRIVVILTRRDPRVGAVAIVVSLVVLYLLRLRFAIPIDALILTAGFHLWPYWRPVWNIAFEVVRFLGGRHVWDSNLVKIPIIGPRIGHQLGVGISILIGLPVLLGGIYVVDRVWPRLHPFNNIDRVRGRPFELPLCCAAALVEPRFLIIWLRKTGVILHIDESKISVDFEGPFGIGPGTEEWDFGATKAIEVSEPIARGPLLQYAVVTLKSAADRSFAIPISTKGLKVPGTSTKQRKTIIKRGEEGVREFFGQAMKAVKRAAEQRKMERQAAFREARAARRQRMGP